MQTRKEVKRVSYLEAFRSEFKKAKTNLEKKSQGISSQYLLAGICFDCESIYEFFMPKGKDGLLLKERFGGDWLRALDELKEAGIYNEFNELHWYIVYSTYVDKIIGLYPTWLNRLTEDVKNHRV